MALRRYSGRMISERDIWMAANMLMRRHGKDAGFRAAQRADELFAKDDFEEHRIFPRIVRQIERLAAKTPDATVH